MEQIITDYEAVVGMEIHVELKTVSKMFCGCRNDPFHAPKPNIYTCPVCLGLPGGLPVPNALAIAWTQKLGLALGAVVQPFSKFDRKNYFYPDLAKGYQISQYDQPLCLGGNIGTELGPVRITRVHLEEDTGKLMHTVVDGRKVTLIDFNRSGVPLVEIVTEPDIRSGQQAKLFLKKLHQIIRYLDISDADMEKGSMRLEPNISIRPVGSQTLPKYKVEVKNINSFSFVKKAIEYEVARHTALLTRNIVPDQETRGWNSGKSETYLQRRKETADDYRYFPEPDIPPLTFDGPTVDRLKSELPELPDAKKVRFIDSYLLQPNEAEQITQERTTADYFEKCLSVLSASGQVVPGLTPQKLASAIVNGKVKTEGYTPEKLIADWISRNSRPDLDESVVREAVLAVLDEQVKAVSDYRSGKIQVLMFLTGMVQKKLSGRGDIALIQSLLTAGITGTDKKNDRT